MRAEACLRTWERLEKALITWAMVTSNSIWIALFSSTLETTIVSTALVSITDDLHGFDLRDWVVTSYLLTYTGEELSDR